MTFSRGSSWPRNQTHVSCVSCTAGGFFTRWAIKEGSTPKNWWFLSVVLKKTLESPLNSKEIKPVNPKGNQPWIFIGRTLAEAEALILWPPDEKNWLIGKDPDVGKDWRQKEKGGNRGWDGWMASSTQWVWIWTNSRRLWRTGEPGLLQSVGLQTVGNDLATEQQKQHGSKLL